MENTMKKQGGKLKDWKIVKRDDGFMHVEGTIYNDPRFNDGDQIKTSTVVNMGFNAFVETENTIYSV